MCSSTIKQGVRCDRTGVKTDTDGIDDFTTLDALYEQFLVSLSLPTVCAHVESGLVLWSTKMRSVKSFSCAVVSKRLCICWFRQERG